MNRNTTSTQRKFLALICFGIFALLHIGPVAHAQDNTAPAANTQTGEITSSPAAGVAEVGAGTTIALNVASSPASNSSKQGDNNSAPPQSAKLHRCLVN